MNVAIAEYYKKKFTIENGLSDNTAVGRVYGYTNENLRQYIRYLNIAGGNTATVGSSLDQALYLIWCDAEVVTVMDANPYTEPSGELKLAAFENLRYKEFMKYWAKARIFNSGVYRELIPMVPANSREFLELLLEESKHCNVGDIIFQPDSFYYGSQSYSLGCEFYDNEKNYKIMQNKLLARKKDKPIKFVLAEFQQFPDVLQEPQDCILISNIFDYYSRREDEFFSTSRKLIDKLKSGGTMQMYFDKSHGANRPFNDKMNQYLGETCEVHTFVTALAGNDSTSYIGKPKVATGPDWLEDVYIYEKN